MSKSTLKIAPALKPRSSLAIPVSPCVFYKMHENTGTAIADSLGNGPNLVLAGTGTPWANRPWITPNGTDNYAQVATASMGILTDLLRLDQAYGHILTAFDFYYDGGLTANEGITFAGVSDNVTGGWGIGINSSSQLQITHRAIGAGNHLDSVFTGYNIASLLNTRISVVVELIQKTVTTFDAVLYVNGQSRSSVPVDVNLLHDSGTALYTGSSTNSTQGFTVAARPNGTSTRDRLLNVAASNAQIGRLLLFRAATRDTTLALKVAQEMYAYQGEFPTCLNGK